MPKDDTIPSKRLKVILESPPPPPPRRRIRLDSTTSSSWEEEEEERVVHLHNAFRRRHGSPPLELSNELSESALIWARKIAQAGYILYDDEDPDVGQSIEIVDVASNDDNESVIEEMLRRWYGEGDNYDFLSPGWRKDAVHFTQMIWGATTDIGVGVAKMDDPIHNKHVVVVHYYPAGNDNFKSQFRENVRPLIHSNGHADEYQEALIIDGEC